MALSIGGSLGGGLEFEARALRKLVQNLALKARSWAGIGAIGSIFREVHEGPKAAPLTA